MTLQILVIDDDNAIRSNIVELLEEEGFGVVAADNGIDGLALAIGREPALVVCDIAMPGMDGHEVLRAVRNHPITAAVPFVFLTAKTERVDMRAGMNLGADDYLTKPFTLDELLQAIRSRLKRRDDVTARLRSSAPPAPGATSHPPQPAATQQGGIVVLDDAMNALYAQAAKAAQSDINILILGETGVGKEILARSIHHRSRRAAGPFVALNCAALTETLLETELFGHEKGAFTGAHQTRPGLLESASGGTVFLDEIGELPPTTQTKLLRVLEDRVVMRVGARNTRKIDVRFLAATNRDLELASRDGTFREDLYYRLNGISFCIPPLRERRSEIASLSRMFIARASIQHTQGRAIELTEAALELLSGYDWPGNVRQLRNVIERAVVLCDEHQLLPAHLPSHVLEQTSSVAHVKGTRDPREQLEKELQQLERGRIVEALEKTAGNQTLAAALLGVSRRTLVYRLTALGMTRTRRRA